MVMWKLKSCPRCGGDMFLQRDMSTWYQQCLQCAYRIEMRRLDKPAESPVTAGVKSSSK